MFFKKSVLSDKDIIKELGKNIYIYPFKEENLKGSTYNLTASLCAWIVDEETKEKQLIINQDGEIEIPAGTTALIQTEESIYVSKKICGTYHSRVSLCTKGLSNIGTTLDPCYFGTSVIALHNNSSKSVKIKKGQGIVSLMFYYMRSSASQLNDSFPFRKDLFDLDIENFYKKYWESPAGVDDKECPLNSTCSQIKVKQSKDIENEKQALIEEVKKWQHEDWRKNRASLINEVNKYVATRDTQKNILKSSIICISVSLFLILALIIGIKKLTYEDNQGFIQALIALIGVIPPTATLIIAILIRYFTKGRKL